MPNVRERIRELVDSLSEDERAEASIELLKSTRTGAAVTAFLEGLDTNDRDRLEFIGKEFFEEHANSFPGPDRFVKANVRQTVYDAIKSFVTKLCTRS